MSGDGVRSYRSRTRGKTAVSNLKKMESLDPEACLKCFVSASKQYSKKKDDVSLRSLQKQLDNLLCINYNFDTYDPRNLVVSDCIISLTDLLNDQTIETDVLKEKILFFFENLAQDQPVVMNVMQAMFNIPFSLVTFLSASLQDSTSPAFVQCLKLLELITRKGPVDFSDGICDNFLLFIIKNIFSSDSALLIPCMKLLSNLCRHSKQVLRRVKTLEKYSAFCKIVMSMVGKESELCLASLSLFSILMQDDPLGQKILSANTIQDMIEIVFSNFGKESKNDDNFAATVDLFIEMLKNERIKNRLQKYKYLKTCLCHLLNVVLPDLSPDSVTKLIQLFNSLNILNDSEAIAKLIVERESVNNDLISCAIERVSAASKDIESCLIALDFLNNTFKFMVPPAEPVDLGSQVNLFLTKIVPILTQPFEADKLITKFRCQEASKSISALTILLEEPLYREKIIAKIDLQYLQNLVDVQFVNNNFPCNNFSEIEWSEDGVGLILEVINFSAFVVDSSPEFEEFFTTTLQDWRLIPFLASALSCPSKLQVHLALTVLEKAMTTNSISIEKLSELIAGNRNKQKLETANIDVTKSATYATKVAYPLTLGNDTKRDDRVDDLIEKVESGLKINDLKLSEVMQMYEHKIESIIMKEKHLYDLLDVKTNELQQVERMLIQYRCRYAQTDSEILNVRRLFQESEKRCEVAKQQTTASLEEQQNLRRQLEENEKEFTKCKNETMEEKNELSVRIANMEETLSGLRKELERSDQMNKILQGRVEELKEQESSWLNKISQDEMNIKNLSSRLKEKEAELIESNKIVDKLHEKCEKRKEELKTKEAKEIENCKEIKALIAKVQSLELEKAAAAQEILTLEKCNNELDQVIRQKDELLKEKCNEIEKQKSITTLIQNITSGRVDLSLLNT